MREQENEREIIYIWYIYVIHIIMATGTYSMLNNTKKKRGIIFQCFSISISQMVIFNFV